VSLQSLLLTLQLVVVAVTIAAAIGIVGAWAAMVLQLAGRIGRFTADCFLLAMVTAVATPLVLHAAAWEATAGKFGWWTLTQTGTRTDGDGVYGVFSGLLACGWIHGAYGSAIVALATWYGTSQTPQSVIQHSQLDVGPVARWWKIRLPIAAPWLIASLLATAAIAATEMTVVDLYGYETIADRFYLYYSVDPSMFQILWTCVLPLTLAGALLMWLFITRRRSLAVQAQEHRSDIEIEPVSVKITLCSFLISALVIAMVTVVPITGLIIKAGHEVTVEDGVVRAIWSAVACWEHITAAPRLFSTEYGWTALIGIATGVTSLLIAWPLAMVGRSHRRVERMTDLITVLVFVIPGPIIGMSVVHIFQLQVPGFRFLYGQTIVPLVIALSVRAVPVSYWVLRSGYRGISDRVIDASRLDLPLLSGIWNVDRPLLTKHLGLALLASSLYASGDVPATLPVVPAGVTTVGTRLFELLHSGARYQEASLAIWYVGVVVLVAIAAIVSVTFRGYSKFRHPS
jgi:iron(III) transport system permease protein